MGLKVYLQNLFQISKWWIHTAFPVTPLKAIPTRNPSAPVGAEGLVFPQALTMSALAECRDKHGAFYPHFRHILILASWHTWGGEGENES